MVYNIPLIKIPKNIPQEGFNVPVLAGFLGLREPRFLSLGGNNLNPLLIVGFNYIKIRAVIITKKFYYQDIECVDISESRLTENLCIIPRTGIFTYTTNLLKKENLIEVLRFLNSKSVKLSKDAKKLIKKN